KEAVLVFSRWAKVAAASTVTTLIEAFGVDLVLFTGVAGAADPSLEIGDVVIGTTLIQHDLDPRPLYPRFEGPLLAQTSFQAPLHLLALARESATMYLHKRVHRDIPAETLHTFGINPPPRLHEGLIISGDQFIANPETLSNLRSDLVSAGLPAPLCVEMEGAAVAQVCHEHGIPVIVMRTISDRADHSAAIDFASFAAKVASHFSRGIVEQLI